MWSTITSDIDQENRVQMVGNVMTEGRIETFPQVGRRCSNRITSTRWADRTWPRARFKAFAEGAKCRVVPQQGGYLVDVVVYKEFEDLPRPENSTAGAATFRFDNSLRADSTKKSAARGFRSSGYRWAATAKSKRRCCWRSKRNRNPPGIPVPMREPELFVIAFATVMVRRVSVAAVLERRLADTPAGG